MSDKPDEGFDLYPTYYVAKLESTAAQRLEEVQILQRAEKDYEEQLRKWHDTATRRLELLKEANEDRLVQGGRCSSCKKLPTVISIERGEYKYKDNHADDCELARELADE